MTIQKWTAVDQYFTDRFLPADPILDQVLKVSHDAGLPPINVSASLGKFLMLLVQMIAATTILEIGTLGGYSTIWLARGLSGNGKVISLELSPKHVLVARKNVGRAGFADRVEVREGAALDLLPRIETEISRPFDLIFIDADKENNPAYFSWAVRLSRRGSLIIIDNVVRDGEVISATSSDPSVQGVRQLTDLIAKEPRVSATAIQTVGSKGYDGFAMARVIA
jgi:predicted O-methyltransferase YrrM